MKIPFLDLKAQNLFLKKEIDAAISAVIHDSAFIGGKYVRSFEENFARLHGAGFALGTGNGTDALRIALFAAGVKEGDEVITAANSFIATSEAISMLGAKVVFVDCDCRSYTIDTTKIEEKLTSRTKAIIPVHLYGQPAEMDAVLSIAAQYGIRVIEDAAQAVLAEYKGRKAGTFGDMAAFSFYPGKNLGALGDAGAVTTNDKDLFDRARMYGDHGQRAKYDHVFEGINSRLDGIQAAVLDIKLRYIAQWTERRRSIAGRYHALLKDVADIVLPGGADHAKHVYHLYVIRAPERDRLREHLRKKGIETGIHYPEALPHLAAYTHLNHAASDFPHARALSEEALSLPIYPEMTEEQIGYVADALKEFYTS